MSLVTKRYIIANYLRQGTTLTQGAVEWRMDNSNWDKHRMHRSQMCTPASAASTTPSPRKNISLDTVDKLRESHRRHTKGLRCRKCRMRPLVLLVMTIHSWFRRFSRQTLESRAFFRLRLIELESEDELSSLLLSGTLKARMSSWEMTLSKDAWEDTPVTHATDGAAASAGCACIWTVYVCIG